MGIAITLTLMTWLAASGSAQADVWNTPGARPTTISSPRGAPSASTDDSSGGAPAGNGEAADEPIQLGEGVPAPASSSSPPPPPPPAIKFLAAKFRLDTKSCSDSGDAEKTKNGIAMIERAATKIDQDLLKCLGDINPVAESKVRNKGALIHCGGSESANLGAGHGGYSEPDKGEITLTGVDPFRPGGSKATEGNAIDPSVNSGATLEERMNARKRQYATTSIAALIFHEALHVNNVSDGGRHSDTNPNDAVYGCHLTCGALATATAEHCLACAGALGNSPSGEVINMCRKTFPSMSMVADVKNAGIFMGIKDKCAHDGPTDGSDGDACAIISAMPQFQNACRKDGTEAKSPECQANMKAELKASLERNMAHPTYAQLSDQVKAAYDKVKAQY